MRETNNELKNTTYEIFIGLLSTLSIVNLVLLYVIKSPSISMVVNLMDAGLTVVFLSDFLMRLFTADSKAKYFFRQYGWADLLASMPFPQFKILRMFRIIRVVRLLRELGPKGILDEFIGNRARSTLLTLLFFVTLLIEFGSLAILSVEQRNPAGPIKTASDAVWFTFVTITTVGYGDMYPVTQMGRLIGILIMSVGVGLFGTLTGYLSHVFLGSNTDSLDVAQLVGPDSEPAPDAAKTAESSTAESSTAESSTAESSATGSTGTASIGTASTGTVSAGTVSAGTVSAGTVSIGTVSTGTVSIGTVSAATGSTEHEDTTKQRIAELKQLLDEQQKNQALLAQKISELEANL